jgi:UDP-N-acetylglucosamine diphosphorylase/glucosamine-1-phosphate N-acetyltransferase
MRDRWEHFLGTQTGNLARPYLSGANATETEQPSIIIDGAVFATKELTDAINTLPQGSKLVKGDVWIAYHHTACPKFDELDELLNNATAVAFSGDILRLQMPWDIFTYNGQAIRADFKTITDGRTSAPLPEGVIVTGKEQVFLEAGATISAGCIINATTGPVYLAKASELLEGVMMRGPVALGEKAVIKMGAKIYSDTTIGEGCKVGGEISNVVFFANSNKGHDGYLGNAVIGEWCNLGADTNCSNLKNNYDEVKVWDEAANKSIKTGLVFCGLLMGDHSKCGINTMFNTGTVVGVSCNIYGGSFPDKFIPSFSWGGSEGMVTYAFDRAMLTANKMMERRGKKLSDPELEMYQYLFQKTAKQREQFHMKGNVSGE